jgi:hypothetical protein
MKTAANVRTHRRGIMLIEALAYMGLLAIVLGVGSALLYRAWSSSIAIRRNSDDIVNALSAGERWRADLREATGPVRLNGEHEIRIPSQRGEVVYAFSEGKVSRATTGRPTRVLDRVKASAMQIDRRSEVTSCRWELELISDRKNVQLKPLFTFRAVAGSEANK